MSENGNLNITGYAKCCNTLNKSLQKHGYSLTVLTNKPQDIAKYHFDLKTEEVAFGLSVPADIKFFSAHYKIDVFKHLANITESYSVLLDSDVLCINDIPRNLLNIIAINMPTYYDITDQVYPAYGRKKIIDDKSLIMGESSIGMWAGGEFLGGDNCFWGDLYGNCMHYWENYQKHYKMLHHQGDEMLTSCAIENYIRNNKGIVNVGTVGGISRFWNARTLHIGKPIEALYDNFLLHLPADKNFLAEYTYVDNETFRKDYGKHLAGKKKKKTLYRRAVSKIKRMFKKR
ncbi:MAG: hypothetical protein FWD94_05615 [Treponema sp.]|nr:hypothetical protein [Treponema sp.]